MFTNSMGKRKARPYVRRGFPKYIRSCVSIYTYPYIYVYLYSMYTYIYTYHIYLHIYIYMYIYMYNIILHSSTVCKIFLLFFIFVISHTLGAKCYDSQRVMFTIFLSAVNTRNIHIYTCTHYI